MSSAAVAPIAGNGAVITEVVVQGVRRFGDVRRFTLGPGYNVMLGLASSGKSTLHDVLLSLLFTQPAEGERQAFASLLPQGKVACRAGMTLSLGGELWRVLKDYQQGVTTLSRFNAAEKKFELVLNDVAQIERWLVETAKIPAGPKVAPIVAFSRKELPSIADQSTVILARRDGPDESGFEERIRGLSLPQRKELLTKLLAEYRSHAEVRTTEFLQDGLRSKLFEVEDIQRKRADVQKQLDELDLEYGSLKNLPKLPDGIEDRIEAYIRLEKQREADLANLLPMQEDANAALQASIPFPYDEKTFRAMKAPMDMVVEVAKRDFILDAGLGLFFVGIVLAFLGSTAMKVGGLCFVGGVGIVLWRGLYVFYRGLESFNVLRKKKDAIDDQLRAMERKFDIETSVVRNLMKAYDTDDPREMPVMAKKRDEFAVTRAELVAKLDKLTVGGRDPSKEHARITRQIADIDQRLQELSKDMTSDPKELEPQIERLDREVMRAEGKKPTPRSKLFQEDEAGGSDSDGKNSIQRLLDGWCTARQADQGRLLRAVAETFSRNLRAISGGKLSSGVFDAEGNLSVRDESKNALISWEAMDSASRDLGYLALRLTLFQLDSKGDGRALIVLDDPFEFEEPRLLAFSRALRALAPGAQVLHLTSRSVHNRLADVKVEI